MKLESIKAYGCGRSISFGPIPVVRFKIGRKQEVIEPSCGGRSTSFDVISCAFSKYLNTAPSSRPCNEEAAAESAQNDVLNDHLSSRDTVPNSVQPQLNMWNESGRNGGWSEYVNDFLNNGYSVQQPSSLTQTGQPMPSSTSTRLASVRPLG
ncbi:hypothetical protein VPH35_019009 [Triticum aestivum]